MVASMCVLNAFWARIAAVLGCFGAGGTCISIQEALAYPYRTIDTVSGLRIVMHANSKRFIHTLPTDMIFDLE